MTVRWEDVLPVLEEKEGRGKRGARRRLQEETKETRVLLELLRGLVETGVVPREALAKLRGAGDELARGALSLKSFAQAMQEVFGLSGWDPGLVNYLVTAAETGPLQGSADDILVLLGALPVLDRVFEKRAGKGILERLNPFLAEALRVAGESAPRVLEALRALSGHAPTLHRLAMAAGGLPPVLRGVGLLFLLAGLGMEEAGEVLRMLAYEAARLLGNRSLEQPAAVMVVGRGKGVEHGVLRLAPEEVIDAVVGEKYYSHGLMKRVGELLRRMRGRLEFAVRSLKRSHRVGAPVGVRPMQSLSELPLLHPRERAVLALSTQHPALRAYAAYKLASKNMLVTDRLATIKPIIYVDMSASMLDPAQTPHGPMPTYLFAAALASALAEATGATPRDIHLFNTSIFDLEDIYKKLEETLRKIAPGKKPRIIDAIALTHPSGGTSINTVLEHIKLRASKGEKGPFIIITDAQDTIDLHLLADALTAAKGQIYTIVINSWPARSDSMMEKIYNNLKENRARTGIAPYPAAFMHLAKDKMLAIDSEKIDIKKLRQISRLIEKSILQAAIPA